MTINVVKYDGRKEPVDYSKINKVVIGACEGVDGVSASEIINTAKLQFVDGISSKNIQEVLINAAKNLVTEDTPNYAIPAARLQMYDLRKKVYGSYKPCKFSALYKKNTALGKYDGAVYDIYTEEDWEYFDSIIVHSRDKDFSLSAVGQLMDKYLVQNRVTGKYYETPQMMYMAISITLLGHIKCPVERRQKIKRFYDAASTFSFSLPTPIMAGARTPTRQFSSCVLIKCGDTLDSINATATAITNYVSKKAGIGLDHGAIRGVGASIRDGEMVHTGLLPFIKYHTAALKSCSQGGVRGGAATTYYPFWHSEFENLIVLKNNKGIEENRERRLDYGLKLNGYFFEELYLKGKDVYLFHPNQVPDVYEWFYSADRAMFKEAYEGAIESALRGEIWYRKVSADTFMDDFLNERHETGRIYVKFTDNVNAQSPFDSSVYPIYQSNLCIEVALPTKEFQSVDDETGRIALCTLASMNMGKFVPILWDEDLREEFFKDCDVLVEALNGLLDYQDYPMIQAKLATDDFRTLGVGVVNKADFHAQLGVKYGERLALEYLNRWMEFLSYGLTKASIDQAEKYGACDKFEHTCYAKGKFPWDLRNKNIDKVVNTDKYLYDQWESLRERVKKVGIRNATLMAVAPTESSAQVLNATNGIEMPKAKITTKASKSGFFKQVVPHPDLTYQYLWEQHSPEDYLTSAAVMQIHVDQSLSTNTFYNPKNYEDGKLPRKDLIKHLYRFYKLGGKTLYYSNIEDGSTDIIKGKDDEDLSCCIV